LIAPQRQRIERSLGVLEATFTLPGNHELSEGQSLRYITEVTLDVVVFHASPVKKNALVRQSSGQVELSTIHGPVH
jgi:hypothetical protein